MLSYISYVFYRFFGWSAPRIPPHLGYWLFARIGDLFYWLDVRGQRVVGKNLRHVMGADVPQSVLDEKVRATFHMQGYNYFDMFRVLGMSVEEIEARVTVEGWEHLESAVARGRGAVVVSAHFGNVDVLMQMVGLRGLKATLVMEHLRPEPLHQYVVDIRSRHGLTIIPVDASLKPLFRTLHAGELVLLALDRDVTRSGIEIEFFGKPAVLPDGYAKLARHFEAPLVLAFGLRLPDHRLRVRIEPAIEVPKTKDRAGDIRAVMRETLDVAEQHIAKHPEQWVMFRPIW